MTELIASIGAEVVKQQAQDTITSVTDKISQGFNDAKDKITSLGKKPDTKKEKKEGEEIVEEGEEKKKKLKKRRRKRKRKLF